MKRDLLKEFESIIMKQKLNENVKQKLLGNLLRLKKQKVNLMVTGATGCGKSSTINALFGVEVAKVGTSVDPETMDIEKYELDNLVVWDTPGLGDGKEADNRHSKRIIDKLKCIDIYLDEKINDETRGSFGIISSTKSKYKVYVVPTDEEVEIARDTYRLTK